MSAQNKLFIDKRLPDSKAFLSLKTAAAVQVLMIFFTKRRFIKHGRRGKEQYAITNNGEITFTYAEAKEKYGLTATRFRRAINDLTGRGFLEITRTGQGQHKMTTHYKLSEQWLKYDSPGFKPAPRPQSPQGNTGFRNGNRLWMRRLKKTQLS